MYIRLRPDVVFMDMVMPLMGGIDALREIRAFDPNAHVLMCSAMGQRELVDEALEAGARGFISKPFTPAQVLETLASIGVVTP
jgi:two-component system chemotaxis response regulator CheY